MSKATEPANRLDFLFNQRANVDAERTRTVEGIDEAIYRLLAPKFANWSDLAKALAKFDACGPLTEKPNGYQLNQFGEPEAWVRFEGLSSVPERERPYLHDWLLDTDGCVRVDFDNCILERSEDESILIFEPDHRRTRLPSIVLSHGTGSTFVELDDACLDVDGDTDEGRIAYLIEQAMESAGYFPGVFHVTDRDGSLKPFSTSERAKAYAEKSTPAVGDLINCEDDEGLRIVEVDSRSKSVTYATQDIDGRELRQAPNERRYNTCNVLTETLRWDPKSGAWVRDLSGYDV